MTFSMHQCCRIAHVQDADKLLCSFWCLEELVVLRAGCPVGDLCTAAKQACCLVYRYIKEGGWVFLDNVHLMQGWIPRLENKLEYAAENAHKDFRCFFSAEPINGAPHVSGEVSFVCACQRLHQTVSADLL